MAATLDRYLATQASKRGAALSGGACDSAALSLALVDGVDESRGADSGVDGRGADVGMAGKLADHGGISACVGEVGAEGVAHTCGERRSSGRSAASA